MKRTYLGNGVMATMTELGNIKLTARKLERLEGKAVIKEDVLYLDGRAYTKLSRFVASCFDKGKDNEGEQ